MRLGLFLLLSLLPLQGISEVELDWSVEDTEETLHNVCLAVYMNLTVEANEAGAPLLAQKRAELAAQHGLAGDSTEDRMTYTLWVLSVLETAGALTHLDFLGLSQYCEILLPEK